MTSRQFETPIYYSGDRGFTRSDLIQKLIEEEADRLREMSVEGIIEYLQGVNSIAFRPYAVWTDSELVAEYRATKS